MKVAVLFENFGPYHLARLRAAAAKVDLLAIECWGEGGEYAWTRAGPLEGFASLTLFPARAVPRPSAIELASRISGALARFGPDAVAIPGWSSNAAFAALRWCLERGVAAVAMSESTAWDKRRRRYGKEAVKRRIASLYSAALVGGSPHVRYALMLGFPPDSVFAGYDAVDNGYFSRLAEESRRKGRPAHLPSRPFFLASGRFIPKKNLPRLLEAYARYRHTMEKTAWDIVLLGDGPLRKEITCESGRLGLGGVLNMPGFLQYDGLPDYYAWAGAFVHASTTEQWGLVVNEAMASGLPVIVSKLCGCCEDLVEDGRNGFTFDPLDVGGLANLMRRVASNECDRAAMGEASRQAVSQWGPEAFAVGLKHAAEYALNSPLPKANWLDRTLLRVFSIV